MDDQSSLPQPKVEGYSPVVTPISRISLGPQRPEGIDRCNNQHKGSLRAIHPQPGKDDVKMTIPHAQLRGAMYWEDSFWKAPKMGKQPVILVPPTGLYGGTAYQHNLAKLLKDWPEANPMWLNIPGAMADWSWKNAEYVVYAIHYISQYLNKKVALIGWSQGNLACQWALTWWPSTRALVNNFISISADFHGTLTAYGVGVIPTSPSILNQRYYSDFITALRAKGGASAWVPHTTIYSSRYDEIVQPQFHSPLHNPSAYLKNDHKTGVTNVNVKAISNKPGNLKDIHIEWRHGKPGVSNVEVKTSPIDPKCGVFIWGHGSLILHPLVWALIQDAISKGGPAQLSRIDTKAVTSSRFTHGLLQDDITKSLTIMGKFVPNLFGAKLFKNIEQIPDYARTNASNHLALLDSKGRLANPTKEEQEIINHAAKYSKKYLEPISKGEVVIPSMFDLENLNHQSQIQMETGKPIIMPKAPGL